MSQPKGVAAPDVEVLVPTAGTRPAELAVTLSGLASQERPRFDVIVSDQSEGQPSWAHPAVAAMVRVLRVEGHKVSLLQNAPKRGMAQQRQFLLDRSRAAIVAYVDDDVWLEPGALARMVDALRRSGAGFVGQAVQGLSYLNDVRPHEWAGFEPVHPPVDCEDPTGRPPAVMQRVPLHNAANLAHIAAALRIPRGSSLLYRVAWVGGCVAFERDALVRAGGFRFGETTVSAQHSGEDVAAEWRVMMRHGGAGVIPSGAVHLESGTTIERRAVDLPDLVFR